MKRIHILSWLLSFALIAGFTACEEQELTGPTIDLSGIENGTVRPTAFAASSTEGVGSAAIFLEENADLPFQTFSWGKPALNAPVAFTYSLQLDTSVAGDFEKPIVLGTTDGLALSYTVGEMNTTLFSALEIESEPVTFYVRVKATVNDPDGNVAALPAMYSDVIEMSAALYSTEVVVVSRVAIIGSATPNGWNDPDTDMITEDEENYYITVALVPGEAKFRQDNDWAVNWGATDFPEGTGEQDGANIPVEEGGLYYVTFNSVTAAYKFEKISMGIVGSATPNGWDGPDVEMTLLADGVTWAVTADLADGEAKFRQNNDWAQGDWGGADFPMGTATPGGANIPVTAGTYQVTFNTSTLAYSFEQPKSIGLIGSATPNGWDGPDMDMANPSGDGTNWWLEGVELVAGEAKFRQDDAWEIAWGGTEFPSGTASTTEGSNIPVGAGIYDVSFNSETGAYNFKLAYSIGIIGSATPGGWDNDTDMSNPSGDLTNWEIVIDLVDGEAKFRLNDAWDTSWGGTEFPSGTAATTEGANIPVTAGKYKVTFNSETGVYEFGTATSIGLIGSATPNGWDGPDMDMSNPSGDLVNWELTATLVDGEAKFRLNDAWDTSWGAADFPSGTGVTTDAPNIPVTAGKYKITFNSETGAYNFQLLTRIGIIGSATAGGWDVDTDMQNPSGDDENWEITIDLVSGEAKFRENDEWTVAWGGDGFPSGTATTDGGNIPVTEAGTYVVTFNSTTGVYNFAKQ